MVSKKAAGVIGGLSLSVVLIWFYLGQSILDFLSTMGIYPVPTEWYGYLSLGFIIIFALILWRDESRETLGMCVAPLVGYSWSSLWDSVTSRLWYEYVPTFLVILIAYMVYELTKRAGRGTSRRLGEAASSKWGLGFLLILVAALIAVLVSQGYTSSII